MNIKNLLIALCLMLGTAVGANAQCLDGENMDIRYFVDGQLDASLNDWATIGSGVEFTNYADLFDIDLSDGMITLDYTPTFGTANDRPVRIQFISNTILNGSVQIIAASADASLTIVPTVSHTGNTITIDFPLGSSLAPGNSAKINVVGRGCDNNPIPSMGQWALLILGLLVSTLAVAKIKSTQLA